MQRRKFIIGTGALATGTAAAMGTGAFSNATVEREVTVETTGDNEALVGLESTSDYAEITGDTLEITFDELNADADFTFEDVFKLTNGGSETVNVDRVNEDGWSYNDEDSPFKILVGNEVNETQESEGRFIWTDGDAADLEPGEELYFGFGFFGDEDGVGAWDEDDVPETITINLGG